MKTVAGQVQEAARLAQQSATQSAVIQQASMRHKIERSADAVLPGMMSMFQARGADYLKLFLIAGVVGAAGSYMLSQSNKRKS